LSPCNASQFQPSLANSLHRDAQCLQWTRKKEGVSGLHQSRMEFESVVRDTTEAQLE
jgi:hypothetical protein